MRSPAPATPRPSEPGLPPAWMNPGWQVWAGQAAIALALTVTGAVRATAGGAPVLWTVVAALAFAGWYAAGLLLVRRSPDRSRERMPAGWWPVGLVVIWAGAITLSADFAWLAFPLWLAAGLLLRLRWAVALAVAVLAGAILSPALHHGAVSDAGVIGPVVGGVFAFGACRAYLRLVADAEERRRLIASLHRAHEEMLALQDELARTQRDSGAGAERTRLSRDIHDTVAQSVSSIGMLARGVLETGPPEHAHRALQQIDQLARDGLTDIRRIVNALMPAELEQAALPAALRRMLDRLRTETGVDAELRVDGTIPALPTAVEVALLRTAQSGLANVRSHANARRVVVTLADGEDIILLDITDDGRGFDTVRWEAGVNRAGGDGSGYGLRAMRERLRELGGGLDVESAPGEGTSLAAHLPLSFPPPTTTEGSTSWR